MAIIKFADMEKEDKGRIRDDIEAVDSRRYDIDKKNRRGRADGIDRFGECALCNHMAFARTEVGIRFALCTRFEHMFGLNSKYPITACTEFSRLGYVSLYDLQQIAWIIDDSTKKAGF